MSARARLLLGALSLCPSPALAQRADPGIPADRFVPAVGPTAFLSVEGADTPDPGEASAAVALGYAAHPIRLTLRGAPFSEPVSAMATLDTAVELGLTDRLAVGLGVPLIVAARGDRLRDLGLGDDRPLAAPTFGDIRLRAKYALTRQDTRFRLAVVAIFTAPAGGERDFAATSGPTVEPRLVLAVHTRYAVAAANLGVRLAPERTLFDTRFGDELTFGVGLSAGAWRLRAVVELAGAVGGEVRVLEARGALRLLAPVGLSLDLGAGSALLQDSPTSPSWRAFLIVRHAH